MFLVLEPEASGTIECFAGPHHAQRKRAAAMPQPPLGRSVVDMCRPDFRRRGACPRNSWFELSSPVTGSSRTKTEGNAECSSFSRRDLVARQPHNTAHTAPIASFSRIMRGIRNERSASRLCRRRVQPSSTHCPDAATRSVGRTGCILEQPVRPLTGQFIPISTAIRIRSEWFLAPSFCLSNDVVLATVL